jgi:transcriptional regulator with XRE-family HTH domain
MPFPQHLRTLRRARGLQQAQLARRAGLSVDTVKRCEGDGYSPSLDTLTKLAAGLDLRLSSLFALLEQEPDADARELADLLAMLTRDERATAGRVLRALFVRAEPEEVADAAE